MKLSEEQVSLIEKLIENKLRIAMAQAIIANDDNANQDSVMRMLLPMHDMTESLKLRLINS